MSILDFERRVSEIRPHGAGLSVDLYSPDLGELLEALDRHQLSVDYLEIFKGSVRGLQEIRRKRSDLPLVYHAEGLWVTQPDLNDAYPLESELQATASQVAAIGASWLTHECATKQMAGYTFGTYLPPLLSLAGAEATADNIRIVQARIDTLLRGLNCLRPLFLLETPPLTYFGFGDLDMAEFFTAITDRVACGVVLDIGHLWTIYRYTGAWQRSSVEAFLLEFLNRFPLERVVQIHVAGLGVHQTVAQTVAGHGQVPVEPPLWLDAHEQSIPAVLFDLLEQVLQQPRLVNLRGVALEVDNKPVPCIVGEFERFTQRFRPMIGQRLRSEAISTARTTHPASVEGTSRPGDHTEMRVRKQELIEKYRSYASAVSRPSAIPAATSCSQGLELYRQYYLPHEILTWGGDLSQMFPVTCQALQEAGTSLEDFLSFWFREPRWSHDRFDFFLLKVDRFVSFVTEVLPDGLPTAQREAESLREAYAIACG
jgi:uncharacterized protein (UPF0276 family)